ncbi:MAG: DUF3575 domain-containing protein [Ignavibacteria bacterium]|nr:DUF3575 domain-containing protein [Ignavibacteria bacterium]
MLAIVALCACMCAARSWAQETPRAGAVSVNLLGVVIPWIDARCEVRLDSTQSVHAAVLALPMLQHWKGYGGSVGYRQYIIPEDGTPAIAGLSVGPMLAMISWSWNEQANREKDDRVSLIVAATLGYKWIWDHVLLEPSVVFGVVPVTPSDSPLSVIYGSVGLYVGYAW